MTGKRQKKYTQSYTRVRIPVLCICRAGQYRVFQNARSRLVPHVVVEEYGGHEAIALEFIKQNFRPEARQTALF